jgi:hypothetical protein
MKSLDDLDGKVTFRIGGRHGRDKFQRMRVRTEAALRLSVVDAANPGNRCGAGPEMVAIAMRNSRH